MNRRMLLGWIGILFGGLGLRSRSSKGDKDQIGCVKSEIGCVKSEEASVAFLGQYSLCVTRQEIDGEERLEYWIGSGGDNGNTWIRCRLISVYVGDLARYTGLEGGKFRGIDELDEPFGNVAI